MVSRHAGSWLANAMAASAFIGTLAFSVTLYGRLSLTRILPFSNAIVVGNWIPLGAAALMGIVFTQRTIPKWRRITVTVMLASLAWYTVAYDLLAPAPDTGHPRYLQGMCIQTTPTSCSACCAANLLRHYGIQADENEMIDLCLTRTSGTPELGLYRGIKLKTRGTQWDIKVFYGDVDTLKQPENCPALLMVLSGPNNDGPPRPWWKREDPDHAVLVFGFSESGVYDVVDPSCGQRRWTVDALRRRWRGGALCLVPRGQ
jgi:hypothetical protein